MKKANKPVQRMVAGGRLSLICVYEAAAIADFHRWALSKRHSARDLYLALVAGVKPEWPLDKA